MAKCWRCGGGKTITMTTTGTHVLPCPTCGGSGELPTAPEAAKKKVADRLHPEVEELVKQNLLPASDYGLVPK